MLNRFANASARQRGLSIVELMVALAISSFLILGITQLYINNKKTYLFQQSQEVNQENGRFALALLNQELAKAGYRRRPDIASPRIFRLTAEARIPATPWVANSRRVPR